MTMRVHVLVVVAVLGAACGPGLPGNGDVIRETRTVGPFTSVSVQDGLRARITAGPASVTVVMDSNILPEVITRVDGETLVLELRGFLSAQPSSTAVSEISMPSAVRLAASGGAGVTVVPPQGTELTLDASGGSTMEVSCLAHQLVRADVSGGSELRACGTARRLELTVSGGSEVQSTAATETLILDGSGGSVIDAVATLSASGTLSGGSSASITGNPATRSISTSGGSTLTFR